jgi:hypothetical protein
MYKIEKGVPIPKRPYGVAALSAYPLAKMEVGDSFFVPFAGEDPPIVRQRLNFALWGGTRKMKMRFATRGTEDGFRVWRTA